jgi:Fe-S-cluster containining protein
MYDLPGPSLLDVESAFTDGLRNTFTALLDANRDSRLCGKEKPCATCCHGPVILASNAEWDAIRRYITSPDFDGNARIALLVKSIQRMFFYGLNPWQIIPYMNPWNPYHTDIAAITLQMADKPITRPLKLTEECFDYFQDFETRTKIATAIIQLGLGMNQQDENSWFDNFVDIAINIDKVPEQREVALFIGSIFTLNDESTQSALIWTAIHLTLWARKILNIPLEKRLNPKEVYDAIETLHTRYKTEIDSVFNFLFQYGFVPISPCVALNHRQSCDIYPVRPILCAATGPLFDALRPSFSGCSTNYAYGLENGASSTVSENDAYTRWLSQSGGTSPHFVLISLEFYFIGWAQKYLTAEDWQKLGFTFESICSEANFRKTLGSGQLRNKPCLCGSGKKAKHCHGR